MEGYREIWDNRGGVIGGCRIIRGVIEGYRVIRVCGGL